MVSAHYCIHQFWNLCFCYILKELYFSPVFDREGDDLNFRSATQSHLCFSIWKHIAPFSPSPKFEQINGHRRSVADLSIKKPFVACPKKRDSKLLRCEFGVCCSGLKTLFFVLLNLNANGITLAVVESHGDLHSTNKAEVTSCWSIISRNKNALLSILVFLRHDWCGSCNQTRFVSQLLSYVNVYCFVGCSENRIHQGVWLGWSWNHLRR